MTITLIGLHSATGVALLPSQEGRSNSAADRLLAMSGFSRDQFLASFSRLNVLEGREWSWAAARLAGATLRSKLEEEVSCGSAVILGREAWRALGLPRAEFFTSVCLGSSTCFLVPHPSGRCRCYNDPRLRAKLRHLLLRLSSQTRSPSPS